MIIGLTITALSLLLLLWLTLMFMWWRKEKSLHDPLATDVALTYLEKCVRLARRGLYASEMYAKEAGTWSGKKVSRAFFSLFPGAASAFAKRDELVGLHSGPSSFFLLSISETQKTAPVKKSGSRKKIV